MLVVWTPRALTVVNDIHVLGVAEVLLQLDAGGGGRALGADDLRLDDPRGDATPEDPDAPEATVDQLPELGVGRVQAEVQLPAIVRVAEGVVVGIGLADQPASGAMPVKTFCTLSVSPPELEKK